MRALLVVVLAAGCATSSHDTIDATPEDVCSHVHTGRVTISVDVEPVLTSRVVATFADTTVSSLAPKCTTKTIAGCSVKECLTADPTSANCQWATRITAAGSMTVAGGASPPLSMSSDATRGYAGISSPGARWAPGDPLKVSAVGGEVAAFDTNLVFPSRVEITAPQDYVEKKNPIPLDWKNGVPLTWKPGVGKVWLHLSQGDPELRKSTDIECEADSAAGKFTIPAETLQVLEGTHDTTTANAKLEVAGRARVELTVSGYAVLVEALHREEPRQLLVALDGVPAK